MQYTDEQREEISINYQRSVRNCNKEGWSKMTPQEKVSDLQNIENYHAMNQNRLAADVSYREMEQGEHGYQTGNSIVISKEDLDGTDYRECVDSVFHEGQHCYFWQGNYFSDVRQQMIQEYSQEQLQEIKSPIPDPEVDYVGYYAHLNETEARTAGIKGVQQLESDRQVICRMDDQGTFQNQILETYDYDALAMATAQQTEMGNGGEGVPGYDLQDGGGMAVCGYETETTDVSGTADNGVSVDSAADMGMSMEDE